MNTKRINDKYHRQDIKIPTALYEQICAIATTEFNARIHQKSHKPEISATLLYLVQLGIESMSNGYELTKKPNTDNLTDTIPITDNEVKALIKDELYPVQSKLDELSELVYRLTNTDNNTDTNIYVENLNNTIDVSTTDINTDNLTDSLTDNITEDNTPQESATLPVNEGLGDNAPLDEEMSKIELLLSPLEDLETKLNKLPKNYKFQSRKAISEYFDISQVAFDATDIRKHFTKIKKGNSWTYTKK